MFSRVGPPVVRRSWIVACVAGIGLVLAGCAREASPSRGFSPSRWGVSASPRIADDRMPIRKGGGHHKIGAPYRIGGRLYVPREQRDYDKVGIASWYGADFHGRKTANGEIFDMNALTAAHPTLPLPSYVYVRNEQNGRTVLVRINDRGPYVGDRIIDLSRHTAKVLGLDGRGLGRVRVTYAGPAPINGSDHAERRYLAGQSWYRSRSASADWGGALR